MNKLDLFLESLLSESIQDKYKCKCIIMAGSAGAGKTHTSSLLIPGGKNFIIGTDSFFEFFLKRDGLSLDMSKDDIDTLNKKLSYRDKAREPAHKKLAHRIDSLLPIILDGTGQWKDKIDEQKTKMEAMGYDVYMIYINTSRKIAELRNQERERKLNPEVVKKIWYRTQRNFTYFKQLFGSDMWVIDNLTYHPQGSPEYQEYVKKILVIRKNTLEQPLENPIGIDLLRRIEEVGGSYLRDIGIDLVGKDLDKVTQV